MDGQGKINEQIVDALLEHMGMRRHGGRKDNAGAMLPLLLMDAQYDLFTKKIATLSFDNVPDADRRAKLLYNRSKWNEAYNAFNKSMFRAWDTVQKDYVCDMMDSMEKEIHNDLVLLQISAMNRMDFLEIEHQEKLSVCVVCNVLAQYAQMMYGIVFRTGNMQKKKSNRIDDVINYSKAFEDEYYKITGRDNVDVNFNLDKSFNQNVDNIATHMMKWLKNYH